MDGEALQAGNRDGIPDSRFVKWLVLVGALGLGLRIALALTISPVLLYDSLEYHQSAQHLVEEGRYYTDVIQAPTATMTGKFYSARAPGYVFFIAAVYRLFGVNDRAVSLVQAVLDFCSGIFVFLIARNWLKPKHSFWAFFGHQILVVYVPMLMSEAFFMFLFLFSLWVLLGPRSERWLWSVLIGLAWGLIILTKPEKIIFVPVFAGYLAWKNISRAPAAKALVWLAIVFMTIAPWLGREYQVHGRFVWMTTRGGMTFFDGSYLPIAKRQVLVLGNKLGLDEAGMDRLFFKVSFDYLKKHPGHYFRTCFKRLRVLLDLKTYNGLDRFFLSPLLEEGGSFRIALAFASYYLFLVSRLVMVLGLAGAILCRQRYRELFLLYAIPLTIVLFHFALFLGKPRYLVPAYPCLCVFFALGMEWLENKGWRADPEATTPRMK